MEPLAKRVWIEVLNNHAMSLLKHPQKDREQVITIWKAGIQGAIALQSEQRFAEACLTYDMMESV